MSSKLSIRDRMGNQYPNYFPQTISTNKSTFDQIKRSTIENFRKALKPKTKISQSTSFTSMSTTFFSKKYIPSTPKTTTNMINSKAAPKIKYHQFKELNPEIKQEMRKVKMKIRKLILNHRKNQPCNHFEKFNYEYNDKIKDFFLSEQRIKAIQKYNSKFHFGQINFNFVNEPLKYLIDVTEFQGNNLGLNEIFDQLSLREKGIIALEPSYFVEDQTLLIKKIKSKSLTQKLNDEEKEEMLKKEQLKDNNKNKFTNINNKSYSKYANTHSDIGKKYFVFNKKKDALTSFFSPKISRGGYLENMKSLMVKDLNHKIKEYELSQREFEFDDYHSFNKARFANTMRHFDKKIYNIKLFKTNNKNKGSNTERKKSVSYVGSLKMRNTKEFLLKSNSERIIYENNHKVRKQQLEIRKNNDKVMNNYLNNIKLNISKK